MFPTPGLGHGEMWNDGSELAAIRRVLWKLTHKGRSERDKGLCGRWGEIQGAREHPHFGQLKIKGGTRKRDGANLVGNHRSNFLRRHERTQHGDMGWDPKTCRRVELIAQMRDVRLGLRHTNNERGFEHVGKIAPFP